MPPATMSWRAVSGAEACCSSHGKALHQALAIHVGVEKRAA